MLIYTILIFPLQFEPQTQFYQKEKHNSNNNDV